ncbi:MAG: hypothetical protein V7711_13175 [Pseudomonadales bacterium]
MSDLISELKRRNVFRVAVAYVVLGWVVIQFTDIAVPALLLPEWVPTLVMFLGLIGLPFAILFAWAFELTPAGLKRSSEVSAEESIAADTSRKLEHAVVVLLVIAIAILIWDRGSSSPDAIESPSQADVQVIEKLEIEKSIAVLPFVNMSDDKDYFADGLTEELLNLLAKNRQLKVAGRTSSFAFKGKNSDLREIGAALGVANVLEGSVRRSGDRLRITAQLINVADGYHLWSETYDKNMSDIFDIQDEVAAAIISALHITLSSDETAVRDRPTDNLEAYTSYLEGLAFNYNLTEDRQALIRFEQAIIHDPEFALAWEARAMTAYGMVGYENGRQSENMLRAHEYALDALTVDPNLPLARAVEVASRGDDYDWYNEIIAFEQAAHDAPERGEGYAFIVWSLVEAGYLVESLEIALHAIRIDPLNPVNLGRHGVALRANGRLTEARQQLEKSMAGGTEESVYFYFVDRIIAGDIEAAILAYEAHADAAGIDLADFRPLIEADFNGERLTPEKAATLSLGINIGALLDFARGRKDEFYDYLFLSNLGDAMTAADLLVYIAMTFPEQGFTSHPRFLELATSLDMVGLWEKRGAPDMCSKQTGEWACK